MRRRGFKVWSSDESVSCLPSNCIKNGVDARFTDVFTTRIEVRGGLVELTTGAIQTGIVLVVVLVLVLDDGAVELGMPTGYRGGNKLVSADMQNFEDEDRFAEDPSTGLRAGEDERDDSFYATLGFTGTPGNGPPPAVKLSFRLIMRVCWDGAKF